MKALGKYYFFTLFLSLFVSQNILADGSTNYLPKGDCDQQIQHHFYSLCYSNNHRQALWTTHLLTKESIQGKQKRTNDFRADPYLKFPIMHKDYSGSGYDRGHLVPAGDMKLSKLSMSESFFMSNVAPQNPGFNRGIWVALENFTRRTILKQGDGFVVTSPVLEDDLNRLSSNVSIPNYFYKIIFVPEVNLMLAFLMPNQKANKGYDIFDYQITVDDLEALTGLDFFSELPNKLEDRLESTL